MAVKRGSSAKAGSIPAASAAMARCQLGQSRFSIQSATGMHWEEANYDWWAMNTDTRSTGNRAPGTGIRAVDPSFVTGPRTPDPGPR